MSTPILSLPAWGQTATLIGALGAAGLLLLVYPAMVLKKYIRIMINILDDQAPPADMDGRDFDLLTGEDVTFRASDGHRLEGTLLRGNRDGEIENLVIFAHEFGSDRTSCLRYCQPLLDAGCDVFAFDFRGHGQSRPETGYRPRQWPTDREKADVLGAIACAGAWLEQQGRARDLLLFGLSRGGGAAVLAADGIPEVKAIITDGVYSSDTTLEYLMKRFATVFAKIRVIAENHPPVFWKFLRWLLFREYACRFGCRFPSVRKALTRLGSRPILMIHGERDSYIPVALTQALFDSVRGPKELWVVPRAKHNEAVLVRPAEYAERLVEFAERQSVARSASLADHLTATATGPIHDVQSATFPRPPRAPVGLVPPALAAN